MFFRHVPNSNRYKIRALDVTIRPYFQFYLIFYYHCINVGRSFISCINRPILPALIFVSKISSKQLYKSSRNSPILRLACLMMARSVPVGKSLVCIGIVTGRFNSALYNITWLADCLLIWNPAFSRAFTTSFDFRAGSSCFTMPLL